VDPLGEVQAEQAGLAFGGLDVGGGDPDLGEHPGADLREVCRWSVLQKDEAPLVIAGEWELPEAGGTLMRLARRERPEEGAEPLRGGASLKK
jgi:hypothetical protein